MTQARQEDKDRLLLELDRIAQVGHGELTIKVADGKIISWNSQAKWELRIDKPNR